MSKPFHSSRRPWSPPKDMDRECVSLCAAINRLPGVATHESCCGHGKDQFRVYFSALSLIYLPDLIYWFDGCHCGFYGWRVVAHTDCGRSPVSFIVEGPVGKDAYDQAAAIAALIDEETDEVTER